MKSCLQLNFIISYGLHLGKLLLFWVIIISYGLHLGKLLLFGVIIISYGLHLGKLLLFVSTLKADWILLLFLIVF